MVCGLLRVLLQASPQQKILKGDKKVLFSLVGGKSTITSHSEVVMKRHNVDALPLV